MIFRALHRFFDKLIVPIIMLFGAPVFALMAIMDMPTGRSFKQAYREISCRDFEKGED